MNHTDFYAQIDQLNQEQQLQKHFPGKHCGTENCETQCAEALKIAQKLNLEPIPFVQNFIADKIAPKYGCSMLADSTAESLEKMRCRFGFVRPETATMFDDAASNDTKSSMSYIFDSTNENCDKCKALDGTTVTAEQMEDEQYMRKLGFWKQVDGIYRPHPHCKCVWKVKDDELQKQIDKIIQDANAELMAALAEAKSIVKNKAEEALQALQTTKFADSDFGRISTGVLIMLRLVAMQQVVALKRKAEKIRIETDSNLRALSKVIRYTPPTCFTNPVFMLEEFLKYKHYDRLNYPDQQPDKLPKSPEDAIKKGFILAPDNQNLYHRNKGQTGNKKYYHPRTGQEVVFDKDEKLVTIPENIGTKNFSPQPKTLEHAIYDVLPYYLWGNSEDDTTPIWNRITGPDK